MFNIGKTSWWFLLAGFVLTLFGAPSAALAKAGAIQGVVNINSASAAELQMLSGVGPAKAQRILEYREKQPFRTVEELGRVKGIGPKTVRKLRLFLTVRGPTTAQRAGAAPPAIANPAATSVAPANPTAAANLPSTTKSAPALVTPAAVLAAPAATTHVQSESVRRRPAAKDSLGAARPR